MGVSVSKTVRQAFGEETTFTCCCKERQRLEIEEERHLATTESTKEEEDLYFLLVYKRTKPRTCCAKISFGLQYFFCDLCPIICCPPCPAAIIHKFVFRPPEHPTYNVQHFGIEDEYRIQLRPAARDYLRLRYRRCHAYTSQLRCFLIQNENCARVVCLYAQNFSPCLEAAMLTILYSHNNGIDLGLSIGYVVMMARRFRVNFFTYDYAGYGRSKGQCSEDSLYQSAEAAFDFVTQELGIPPEKIVLAGSSLGTAATIHLASNNPQVKGVILQGGFLSALRIVCPTRTRVSQLDRFVNMRKIDGVTSPTLVIHGKQDKLFSVVHALMLHDLCPGAQNVEPLLIDKCGHIDFEEHSVYWQRIHTFLHTELTTTGIDTICCTYHQTEIEIRQRSKESLASRTQTGIEHDSI